MSVQAWLVRRKIRAAFRPKQSRSGSEEDRLRHFDRTLTAMEDRLPGAPADATVETVNDNGVRGDWIFVPGARDDRILLYSHGGGYVWGSPKNYHDLGARLSRALKARVFLLDYRLAPKHKCPAAVDDALAAYAFIRNAYPQAKIGLCGDSAGGGLALASTLLLKEAEQVQPVAVGLISPWLDVSGSGASIETNKHKEVMLEADGIAVAGKLYRGDMPADDPRCSPLFGDHDGMPPILAQVGSEEILLSDSVRLAEKVRAAGGEIQLDVWPKMHHVWHMSAGIVPEGKKAIEQMAAFFEQHWGNGK
ncbi:MAG: alpha/beta hydrolase [Alphaproteobacteria bacterium]|nr:alpha/beta hydrolase [Alphaproteobacteria bacterium]